MIKLPYWHKAATGMHIGLAKFAYLDDGIALAGDGIERERIIQAHAQLIVGLHALEEFSTRDYAYERGGQTVSDKEMEMFMLAEWTRKGEAS